METFFLYGFLMQNRILTTGLGPLFENVPPRSAMLLLQVHESANGMARPCSCPARRKVLRGIKKHKEHVPCHTSPHHPPSAQSASISVRIASILSVSINAGRSFGNSNARALNLSAGSPTFRAA